MVIASGALLPLALAACDSPKVSIEGHGGVPLARLDLAGRSLGEITLLSPDTVRVVRGDRPAIRVEGDARAQAALRFVLANGKLGITRDPDSDVGNGIAIVTITDPSLDHLIMAGSGTISTDRLSGVTVGVTIGGSGTVIASGIDAARLDVEVLGSGTLTGSGHTGKLALSLAGSGVVDLAGLKADAAAIDLSGTGHAEFASDGPVGGAVDGSGSVTVHGKAQCAVHVNGPGQITCQP